MWTIKTLSLVGLIVLSGLLALGATPHLTYAGSTMVQVDPATTNVSVGDTFTVNWTISDVVNLTAWEVRLYYLKSLLNCTGITEGPFLRSGGASTSWPLGVSINNDYNDTHGRIVAPDTVFGQTWVSGSGVLARVTFRAKAHGDALLHLGQTTLLDNTPPPNAQEIPHTAVDGTVHITSLDFHDVAVLSVTSSKSGCLPLPTVGQGRVVAVTVLVENQGVATETFNATLSASRLFSVVELELYGSAALGWGFAPGDMTSPGPAITVHQGDRVSLTLTSQDGLVHRFFVDYNGDTVPSAGEPTSPDFTTTTRYAFDANTAGSFTYYCQYHKVTMYGVFTVNPLTPTVMEIGKQSTTLDAGSTGTLLFSWDTTGYPMGNYTLIATADTVPNEDDTADNTLTNGWILVTIAGDIDGDLDVDIFDIVRMAGVYGVAQPDPRYDPNSDVDGDGDIDIFDIVAAAANYGKKI